MSEIESILSRLEKVKSTGLNKWQACCPAHVDNNPSLNLEVSDSGKILWNCKAGCDQLTVGKFLGFEKKRDTDKRQVATYDYTDEPDVLRFQVVRFEPKDFRQRKPVGDGWEWNIKGVRKVPYRLPELLTTVKAGGTVFIVEGEKDVDTLRAHGLTATCNAGGAGKWTADHAKHLKGADVVIIPDADAPGAAHAEIVAKSLQFSALRVRVMAPLPGGKDSSDWFNAGGTTAQLRELAEATPEYHAVAPVADATRLTVAYGMVILPNDYVSYTDAAKDIFARLAKNKTMFMRGTVPVELIETEHGPALELLRQDAFRSRVEMLGTTKAYVSHKSDKLALVDKRVSADMAVALLATTQAREILPPIKLIASAPLLVLEDGKAITLTKGYNAENGGTLITGGQTPPDVPLDEAVSALRDLHNDFDYVSPGDHSRALASYITPCLRMGGMLRDPCPMDVAEADESQSGKTFRQQVGRAIHRERSYVISQKAGGVGSLDESLSAALLSGKPFISFDNMRGRLDSQFLEMVVTWRESVAVRVPHRGEVLVDATGVSFQISSNGVETTRDTANRCSIVRIKKRPASYVFKKYPEGNLLDHVEARQAFYLGCVHSVVRHWIAAGMPTKAAEHDFRQWAGALNWIVTEIFGAATLMDGHASAQKRVSNPALAWLRTMTLIIIHNGDADKEMSAAQLWDAAQTEGVELPGIKTELDDEKGRQAVGRILAKCFKESETVTIDGYAIQRIAREEYVETQRANRPVKRYLFSSLRSMRPSPVTSIEKTPFLESSDPRTHRTQNANVCPRCAGEGCKHCQVAG